jgi:hypothetical protein
MSRRLSWLLDGMLIDRFSQQDHRTLRAHKAEMSVNCGLLKFGAGKRTVASGADNANHGELLLLNTVILYSKQQGAILYANRVFSQLSTNRYSLLQSVT